MEEGGEAHVDELRAELVLRRDVPEAQQEGVQACKILQEGRGLRGDL